MKKINNKFIVKVGGTLNKNAPTILTVAAVIGCVLTTASAIKDTPKAMLIIEKRNKQQELHDLPVLTRFETVKATYKCYLPTITLGLFTSGCIIGSNVVSVQRQIALASMYGLTETAFREYKNKVVSSMGESVHKKLREDIAGDHIENYPATDGNVIFTGQGDVLCYDDHSGRFFKTDVEKIRAAQSTLNHRLLSEMKITINDLYYEIGLPQIPLGDSFGWEIEDGWLEISFAAMVTTENQPAIVILYEASVLD